MTSYVTLYLMNGSVFVTMGKMQICSVVQLSGFFMCLMGAARITHRAQGIVSIATRWHMTVTNTSAELESDQWKSEVPEEFSGNDSDSSDIYISVTPQQPSSFQTRQALGEFSFITHHLIFPSLRMLTSYRCFV